MRKSIPTMAADDARQYMLNDEFEIYEKVGIPSGAMEMHFHNFYEIMYIAEGEFEILLNNTTYQLHPGDILLIDRNHLHHYQYAEKRHENCRRLLIWVSQTYLDQISEPGLNLAECFSISTPAWHFPAYHREHLTNYLMKLIDLETDTRTNPAEIRILEKSYMALFFVALNQLCRRPEFSFPTEQIHNNPMIRTLTTFINAHIDETITLDMLADQAGLSKYHFVRVFKDLTGMTVHDFINHKRIIKACEMIWDGEPLGDLYSRCGFSDYSSFFRNFKAIYDISPSEFKAFYEKDPELP
ncbi:MAG: AraC family transcriptional regulator [Lachnospiraceae bacterium]|nr:AraC family transcriptional regulator [Lachnospiraceae bacterium]